VATALFTAFWFRLAPHPWQRWSVLGSSAILFSTNFSVQVSVAINVSRLAPFRHALVYRLSELDIAYRGRGVALARPDDYIAYSTPIRRRHRSIGKGAFGFGEPDKLDGADAGSRECRKKSMPP